jgi:hypothetical protein
MANRNGGKAAAVNPLNRLVKQSTSQVLHMARIVFEARGFASGAWEQLEAVFVHRVARALNALQIPTARDVHELSRRIEALQGAVIALEQRAAETAARTSKAGTRKNAGRNKKAPRAQARARA